MYTNRQRKTVCLPVGILPLLYKIGNGNWSFDENTEIPVSRISHPLCTRVRFQTASKSSLSY